VVAARRDDISTISPHVNAFAELAGAILHFLAWVSEVEMPAAAAGTYLNSLWKLAVLTLQLR
jgi:hypothetical protein